MTISRGEGGGTSAPPSATLLNLSLDLVYIIYIYMYNYIIYILLLCVGTLLVVNRATTSLISVL